MESSVRNRPRPFMLDCYKYGAPPGVDKEKLEKEFAEMSETLDRILNDPKEIEERENSAKLVSHITAEQLYRPFTI